MSILKMVITKKQLEAVSEVSKTAIELVSEGVESEALDLARVAVDLTNGNGLLKVSPSGVSVGDRVKCNLALKRRTTIPKNTPGNVVGFDEVNNKYLVLFFPVWFPQGALVLVSDKDLTFISKPKTEEDTEQVLNPSKFAIVQAFANEALAKSGLEISESWSISKSDSGEWKASSVIKKNGVMIPRGNKSAAGVMVDEVVASLSDVVSNLKKSDLSAFVDLIRVRARSVSINHKHLPRYPLLEVTYKIC